MLAKETSESSLKDDDDGLVALHVDTRRTTSTKTTTTTTARNKSRSTSPSIVFSRDHSDSTAASSTFNNNNDVVSGDHSDHDDDDDDAVGVEAVEVIAHDDLNNEGVVVQQASTVHKSKETPETEQATRKKTDEKDLNNDGHGGSIDLAKYVGANSSSPRTPDPDLSLLGNPHKITSLSEFVRALQGIHYFWTSPIFLQVYAVLIAVIIIRRFWVLQVISMLIVGRMVRLCITWGVFVWYAPDVRRLKSLILWWIKFGLDFASKTVEGSTFTGTAYKFVASVNYHFWSGIGKDLTLGTIKSIADSNKQRVIKMNKDMIQRTNENRQRITSSLRTTLRK